jgi:hypothetical protein
MVETSQHGRLHKKFLLQDLVGLEPLTRSIWCLTLVMPWELVHVRTMSSSVSFQLFLSKLLEFTAGIYRPKSEALTSFCTDHLVITPLFYSAYCGPPDSFIAYH